MLSGGRNYREDYVVICKGEIMFSSTCVRDIKETVKNKSSVFHNHRKTQKKNLKSKEKAEKEKISAKTVKKLHS